MAQSALIVHGDGAREVSLDQLRSVPCSAQTETYFPIPHHQVVEQCVSTLQAANFQVDRMRLCLARHDQQMFATIDLKTMVSQSVNLCVGLRSSINRTLPLGLVAGSRVWVCANLAFRADLINVRRKHTRYGFSRFQERISQAIGTLDTFREAEANRIRTFQNLEITDETAESLILRAYEKKLVSHRYLPRVLADWRKPAFEEFAPRTLFSLENCFTGPLADMHKSNPQRFAGVSMSIQGLLSEAAKVSHSLAT